MGSSCCPEGVLPPLGVISKCGSPAITDTPLSSEKRATGQEVECDNASLEAQICAHFSNAVSLGMKKGLHKSSTFPTSAGEEAELGGDPSRDAADVVVKDVPAYERSLSLPPTLKPISAMKGSRQKNGLTSPTLEIRCVKWAPDVYDPPVTSVCHSVNSSYHYQRRSKPRKKEKKQKKKQKTKSKKNHHNPAHSSSALETPGLGLEESDGQSSLNKDLGKHEAVILDYSIGNEAKCGSSFLRESISNMHFSIAEAS